MTPKHRAVPRTLVWLRNDLRVADNPALTAACERGDAVAVYLAAPAQWARHGMGANRIAFLLRTVVALSRALAVLGIPLLIRSVPRFAAHPATLVAVAREVGADVVTCNDEYPLDERRRDGAVFDRCRAAGIELRRFTGGVVLAPGEVLTGEGKPYTVFTPFKRRWLALAGDGRLQTLAAPDPQPTFGVVGDTIPQRLGGVAADLLAEQWPGGEAEAMRRLDAFVARALARYHADRDRPDRDGTSGLSPYLAVGAVSARQCIVAARHCNGGRLDGGDPGAAMWISELIWREFYAHVTAAFPDISRVSILCEIVSMREDLIPDVSLGTHFLNELVEMDMLYLALFPKQGDHFIDSAFFEQSPSRLLQLVPTAAAWQDIVRVVFASDTARGAEGITLVADAPEQRFTCYFGR